MASAALLAVVGMLTAAGAGEAVQSVIAKPSGTLEQLAADQKDCAEVARKVRGGAYGSTPYGAGGTLVVGVLSDGTILGDTTRACLAERGWASVALTKSEASAFNALGGPARDRWLEAFYAGDISERVKAALPEPFHPLPPLRDGPYRVGALTLDPDSFALPAGVVRPKDVVMTGSASHRAVARLTRPLDSKVGFGHVKAPAGALFQQMDYSGGRGPPAWCGAANPNLTWCFWDMGRSYDVSTWPGRDWLAGAIFVSTGSLRAPEPPLHTVSPISLELVDGDPLGPVDITLEVLAVKPTSVLLQAVGHRGKARMMFWHGELPVGADGTARLSTWSRVLVLTPSGGGVMARWEPASDGAGWPLR
ncbi:MAG: hypothetical protein JWP35_1637 [Caulobacter sp.]|nr:hypothetical protein [Caulobacter sp.]